MDVLDISLIKLDVEVQSKDDLFVNISRLVKDTDRVTDADIFYGDMKKREADCPTAFGNLIAIPHAKSQAVKSPFLGFFRLKEAINWAEETAQLVFFIGVDAAASRLHLKILAAVSRQLIEEDFREQLLKARTETEILNILQSTLTEE